MSGCPDVQYQRAPAEALYDSTLSLVVQFNDIAMCRLCCPLKPCPRCVAINAYCVVSIFKRLSLR